MTKHPSEAELALFAGGDLGSLRRWRVERHVAACAECQVEVSEFSELRAAVPAMMEPPNISWTKLAVEMKPIAGLGGDAWAPGTTAAMQGARPPPKSRRALPSRCLTSRAPDTAD
jgi:anti-sigma factor RsiW